MALPFDYDPAEPVTLLGMGRMELKTAINKLRQMAPEERADYAVFRERGRDPVVLERAEVELLRTARLLTRAGSALNRKVPLIGDGRGVDERDLAGTSVGRCEATMAQPNCPSAIRLLGTAHASFYEP